MPKLKTRSAVKKRVDFTASGKMKRRHAYHSHLLTKNQQEERDHYVLIALYLLLVKKYSKRCWLNNI